MAQFRVGQMVKVVDGPRAGEVTRIASEVFVSAHHGRDRRFPPEPVHRLELMSAIEPGNCCAPIRWLRPYDEGREKSDLATMPEWIRRLAGVGENA